MKIRIGTRFSPLALWQANFVAAELSRIGHSPELIKITTAGDVNQQPLGSAGGTGLFTKEIQRALLDNHCDVAVHSLKDLPTVPVARLCLASVPIRENVSDCWISGTGKTFADIPAGSIVGTGSPRRKSQILTVRPDLIVRDIRGNVDTRLKKLDAHEFDAIVLAFAGLHRLNLLDRVTEALPFYDMLPAVGQGALGLEVRTDDTAMQSAISQLDHRPTHFAVACERRVLSLLKAGCLAPVAAYVETTDADGLVSVRFRCRVYNRTLGRRIELDQVTDSVSLSDESWLGSVESISQKAFEELDGLGVTGSEFDLG